MRSGTALDRESATNDPSIRTMEQADCHAVLTLLRETMGWDDDDRTQKFFHWKHHQNPFGPSPGWLGLDEDGRIVAVRLMMRWQFDQAGTAVSAVRAVDTATHPSQQGKGWFTRLTMRAVDDLSEAGVDFVFNTPNDKSWPGYEKMGWVAAPSISVTVRPVFPRGLFRLTAAKQPADKWTDPVGGAPRAGDFLDAERPAIERILAHRAIAGPETSRSFEYLRWRYGFEPLGYQMLSLGQAVDDGVIIYRARNRGIAREVSVCELLTPTGNDRSRVRLVRHALADSGSDYAIATGDTRRAGKFRVPGQSPNLVHRQLASTPIATKMSLGDLELF